MIEHDCHDHSQSKRQSKIRLNMYGCVWILFRTFSCLLRALKSFASLIYRSAAFVKSVVVFTR